MLCGLAEGLAASDSVAILAARVQLDYSPQEPAGFPRIFASLWMLSERRIQPVMFVLEI